MLLIKIGQIQYTLGWNSYIIIYNLVKITCYFKKIIAVSYTHLASEKLTTVFYDISQKIYNQQAQANQTGATENAQNTENTNNNNGNVYDTEYKVEEEGNDNNNQ